MNNHLNISIIFYKIRKFSDPHILPFLKGISSSKFILRTISFPSWLSLSDQSLTYIFQLTPNHELITFFREILTFRRHIQSPHHILLIYILNHHLNHLYKSQNHLIRSVKPTQVHWLNDFHLQILPHI